MLYRLTLAEQSAVKASLSWHLCPRRILVESCLGKPLPKFVEFMSSFNTSLSVSPLLSRGEQQPLFRIIHVNQIISLFLWLTAMQILYGCGL